MARVSAEVAQLWADERAALERSGTSTRPWALEQARIYGVSVATVYRRSAPTVRKRKVRSDSGVMKSMERDDFMDAAALIRKKDIDAELAIDVINHNRAQRGEPPIDVHPETLRRHLRQLGISRKDNARDLRIHRRWEAPYPGFLWQIDATVSQSYYLDGQMQVVYEPDVNRYKNKPGNQRPRISLITVIDDHTRVTWGRFTASANALAWRHVLLLAMETGAFAPPEIWPAFGVPERVYSDQGSEIKSGIMTRTLELLGVELLMHHPSSEYENNAQATGKVEKRHDTIRQGFEKLTRGDRFTSLDEMNEAFTEYLVHSNNSVHSSTGAAPFERWLTAAQIRVLPSHELLRVTSYKEEERLVGPDLSIKLKGKVYQLPIRAPFQDHVGRKVPVLYLDADLSKITVVLNGEAHELDAVEAVPDVAGQFKSAPVPLAVELSKALAERDTSHLDVHGVHRYRNQQDPRSYPIRPQEVEHPVIQAQFAQTMVREGKVISRLQMAKVVSTPPTPSEVGSINALLAGREEIPETELLAFIERHRQTRDADVIPMRAQR